MSCIVQVSLVSNQTRQTSPTSKALISRSRSPTLAAWNSSGRSIREMATRRAFQMLADICWWLQRRVRLCWFRAVRKLLTASLRSRTRTDREHGVDASGRHVTRTKPPVSSQVDAADSQVVSGANESRLQLQSSGVRLHGLLAAAPVGQRGPQPVPQQVVLRGGKETDANAL